MISVGANQFDDRFYVYSRERAGGACWWRANGRGYTEHIAEAGMYTLDEVNEILRDSHAADIPVPVELLGIIRAIVRDRPEKLR